MIGSQGRKEIVIERNGERRFLPLAHAGKFTLFRAELFALSVGDTVRITKNFRADGIRFRNNELQTVTAIEAGKVTLDAPAQTLLIHWSLGSILVTGPKTEAFFERFCEHKVALVKADGKDIMPVSMARRDGWGEE